MKRELRITKDGSHTLFVEELGEHYHSVHGAIQESMHIFIEHGAKIAATDKEELNILEIGFGTGLNAILTWLHLPDTKVNYYGIEQYPVDLLEVGQFNYLKQLKAEQHGDVFTKMHEAKWDVDNKIDSRFTLYKAQRSIEKLQFPLGIDVVYFDAFAPDAQPELWTIEIFKALHDSMNPGAILVTYCAKGQVKRDLRAAGFKQEALSGPPGKREMTRATKV